MRDRMGGKENYETEISSLNKSAFTLTLVSISLF